MKRYFVMMIAAALYAAGCTPKGAETGGMALGVLPDGTETEDWNAIRKGDLLFVGIPGDYYLSDTLYNCGEIPVTYIHTSMLDVDSSGVWVVDATFKRGVDRHPIDSLVADFALRNGRTLTLEVWRVKNNNNVSSCVEAAKAHMGTPYDIEFTPDNDYYYCTELIYESYVNGDGSHIFTAAPLDFGSGTIGEVDYWQRLASRVGGTMPQDVTGTVPSVMRAEECLAPVDIDVRSYLKPAAVEPVLNN